MNIRRYVLPSLLVLLLGGIYAGAQTINKALQLSQDNTGAFSVDSFLGVYFPGHILSPTGGARPAPTVSSGATTPTIAGTDTSGVITVNALATTVTATFGTAYGAVPKCVVSNQGTVTTTTAYTHATTSIAITLSGAAGVNNILNYWCASAS